MPPKAAANDASAAVQSPLKGALEGRGVAEATLNPLPFSYVLREAAKQAARLLLAVLVAAVGLHVCKSVIGHLPLAVALVLAAQWHLRVRQQHELQQQAARQHAASASKSAALGALQTPGSATAGSGATARSREGGHVQGQGLHIHLHPHVKVSTHPHGSHRAHQPSRQGLGLAPGDTHPGSETLVSSHHHAPGQGRSSSRPRHSGDRGGGGGSSDGRRDDVRAIGGGGTGWDHVPGPGQGHALASPRGHGRTPRRRDAGASSPEHTSPQRLGGGGGGGGSHHMRRLSYDRAEGLTHGGGGGAGGSGAAAEAAAAAAAAAAAVRSQADLHAWRAQVGSKVVEFAWEKLAGAIVQTWVYDVWWGMLSPDRTFPAEVRRLLHVGFGGAAERARRRLAPPDLLLRDVCDALAVTVESYRAALERLGGEQQLAARAVRHAAAATAAAGGTGPGTAAAARSAAATPLASAAASGGGGGGAGWGAAGGVSEPPQQQAPAAGAVHAERERLLQAELRAVGALHPAFDRPDGHYRALADIADALACVLWPEADAPACGGLLRVRPLLRELLAACVLRPVMQLATPYTVTRLIVAAFPGAPDDRPSTPPPPPDGGMSDGAATPAATRPSTSGPSPASSAATDWDPADGAAGSDRRTPPPPPPSAAQTPHARRPTAAVAAPAAPPPVSRADVEGALDFERRAATNAAAEETLLLRLARRANARRSTAAATTGCGDASSAAPLLLLAAVESHDLHLRQQGRAGGGGGGGGGGLRRSLSNGALGGAAEASSSGAAAVAGAADAAAVVGPTAAGVAAAAARGLSASYHAGMDHAHPSAAAAEGAGGGGGPRPHPVPGDPSSHPLLGQKPSVEASMDDEGAVAAAVAAAMSTELQRRGLTEDGGAADGRGSGGSTAAATASAAPGGARHRRTCSYDPAAARADGAAEAPTAAAAAAAAKSSWFEFDFASTFSRSKKAELSAAAASATGQTRSARPSVDATAAAAAAASRGQLRASVAAYEMVSEPIGFGRTAEYVVYKIRVADLESGSEWTVARRFRNFEALATKLASSHPRYRSLGVALPPKRIFIHTADVAFVNARRGELDSYLGALLGDPLLASSYELREFLSPDPPSPLRPLDPSHTGKRPGPTPGHPDPAASSAGAAAGAAAAGGQTQAAQAPAAGSGGGGGGGPAAAARNLLAKMGEDLRGLRQAARRRQPESYSTTSRTASSVDAAAAASGGGGAAATPDASGPSATEAADAGGKTGPMPAWWPGKGRTARGEPVAATADPGSTGQRPYGPPGQAQGQTEAAGRDQGGTRASGADGFEGSQQGHTLAEADSDAVLVPDGDRSGSDGGGAAAANELPPPPGGDAGGAGFKLSFPSWSGRPFGFQIGPKSGPAGPSGQATPAQDPSEPATPAVLTAAADGFASSASRLFASLRRGTGTSPAGTGPGAAGDGPASSGPAPARGSAAAGMASGSRNASASALAEAGAGADGGTGEGTRPGSPRAASGAGAGAGPGAGARHGAAEAQGSSSSAAAGTGPGASWMATSAPAGPLGDPQPHLRLSHLHPPAADGDTSLPPRMAGVGAGGGGGVAGFSPLSAAPHAAQSASHTPQGTPHQYHQPQQQLRAHHHHHHGAHQHAHHHSAEFRSASISGNIFDTGNGAYSATDRGSASATDSAAESDAVLGPGPAAAASSYSMSSTGVAAPLYELIDTLFGLQGQGFLRRQVIAVTRQMLSLLAGDAIDTFVATQLRHLTSEHSLARMLLMLHASLFPAGCWYSFGAPPPPPPPPPAQPPPPISSPAPAPAATSSATPLTPAASAAGAVGNTPSPLYAGPSAQQGGPPAEAQQAQGGPRWRPPAPITAEAYLEPWPLPPEAEQLAERARARLFARPPMVLVNVVGARGYARVVSDVWGVFSSRTMLLQLLYRLWAVVLVRLWPELEPRLAHLQPRGVAPGGMGGGAAGGEGGRGKGASGVVAGVGGGTAGGAAAGPGKSVTAGPQKQR